MASKHTTGEQTVVAAYAVPVTTSTKPSTDNTTASLPLKKTNGHRPTTDHDKDSTRMPPPREHPAVKKVVVRSSSAATIADTPSSSTTTTQTTATQTTATPNTATQTTATKPTTASADDDTNEAAREKRSQNDALLALIPRLDAPDLDADELESYIALFRAKSDVATWRVVCAKPRVRAALRVERDRTTIRDLYDAIEANNCAALAVMYERARIACAKRDVDGDETKMASIGALLSGRLLTAALIESATNRRHEAWFQVVRTIAATKTSESIDAAAYARAVVLARVEHGQTGVDVGSRLRDALRRNPQCVTVDEMLDWAHVCGASGLRVLSVELVSTIRLMLSATTATKPSRANPVAATCSDVAGDDKASSSSSSSSSASASSSSSALAKTPSTTISSTATSSTSTTTTTTKKRHRSVIDDSTDSNSDSDDDSDDDDDITNKASGPSTKRARVAHERRTFTYKGVEFTIPPEAWMIRVRPEHVRAMHRAFVVDPKKFVSATRTMEMANRALGLQRGMQSHERLEALVRCTFGDAAIKQRPDRLQYHLRAV